MLERIESLVEGAIEGTFRLILRGRIEPLDIARRLTREAEEQKIITLNHVYVPNRFTVQLHPADMTTLKPIVQELQAEFKRYVGEWVTDRDYAVTGPIRVDLVEEAKAGRGRIRVQTVLDELDADNVTVPPQTGPQLQVLPGGLRGPRERAGGSGPLRRAA